MLISTKMTSQNLPLPQIEIGLNEYALWSAARAVDLLPAPNLSRDWKYRAIAYDLANRLELQSRGATSELLNGRDELFFQLLEDRWNKISGDYSQ